MKKVRTRAAGRIAALIAALTAFTLAPLAAQTNVAQGKAISASSYTQVYAASNANDGNVGTYWEGAASSYPATLTVDLGSDTAISAVEVLLNPSWGTRTQTFSILGMTASGSSYSTLASSASYTFTGGTNLVNVPVTATARYVRLSFTANDQATSGQAAEFRVYGTQTVSQTPYGGSARSVANGAVIQAEDYDLGGSGAAYYDVDSGNSGGAYRSDAVDIEGCSDAGGGYNVGWMRDGEWLEYTVNAAAGTYDITFRAASGVSGSPQAKLLLNGASLGTVTLSGTGGWQTFQDFTLQDVAIPATTGGVLRLEVIGNDYNVNYMKFVTDTPVTTYALTVNSGSGDGSYAAGTTVTIAADTPANGYEFAGWTGGTASAYGNAASATTTYVTQATAQTIQANYSAITVPTYSLTVTSGSGDGIYEAGTAVTIVADTPASGYAFTGWTGGTASAFGNAASATTTYVTQATAQTIQANYSAITVPTYSLTVTNGSGDGTYEAGTAVTIVADSPASGYVFSGWTGGTTSAFGNAASSTTTYVTQATAQTIQANYTLQQTGTNIALGKSIEANSSIYSFVAANANDGSASTYWEGGSGSYPNALTVKFGANADVTGVTVKLNPDTAWSTRTQTIEVLGREQSASGYTTLKSAATYTFDPSSGNAVTIAVSGRVADVRLSFTSNSGASAGQCAEFEVTGAMAPNPDLIVSGMGYSPASPTEATDVTVTATVKNQGSAAASASDVTVYVGGSAVGTASVPALSAGSSATVSVSAGSLSAGTYSLAASVDESNAVIETDDSNNAYTGTSLTVAQVQSSDLVPTASWSPSNPSAGTAVTFSVAIANQGIYQSASGAHAVTLTVTDTNGSVVKTLTGSYSGTIAAGSSASVTLGSWTAADGGYTVTSTVAVDANEVASKQGNNTSTKAMVIGRGAAVPYTRYESEDSTLGGAAVLRSAPTFDYALTASEASNQKYVALPSNGSYVEWTANQAGAGVTMRFTMPDSSDGMGLSGSLDCYVNGSKVSTIALSSYWSWQYFTGDSPQDAPNGGQAAFRFDEVHWKLPTALSAGDKIRIQKTNGDSIEYGVDFLEIEPVPAAIAKPAGSLSVTDYGAVANDGNDDMSAFVSCVNAAAAQGKVMYIPEGQFDLGSMWVIGTVGDPIQDITITGAGIWYTNIMFTSPNASSGGISMRIAETGKIDFSNMYINSMLRSRYGQMAVYKCFMDNFGNGSWIHDFWEEHFECGFWVADYAHTPAIPAQNLLISNGRVRNNLADGINFCQGTSYSTVENCNLRNNGDDALAMWPDATMGAVMEVGNQFNHNTIENNWRAGGIAIFGGSGHSARYNYIKDCFMGSGIRMNTVFPGYHFETNTGIVFSDTTIVNSGTSHDCYDGERGAIDLEASNSSIKNVTFENIDVYNTQRDGIQFGYGGGFENVVFKNIVIDGTGLDDTMASRFTSPHLGAAIYTYTGNGSATFMGLTVDNIELPEVYLIQNGFVVTIE